MPLSIVKGGVVGWIFAWTVVGQVPAIPLSDGESRPLTFPSGATLQPIKCDASGTVDDSGNVHLLAVDEGGAWWVARFCADGKVRRVQLSWPGEERLDAKALGVFNQACT